jgi:hypothetical protein
MSMDDIKIERLGGLAGYGSPHSRLKSRGTARIENLSAEDRQAVEALFGKRKAAKPSLMRDGFSYRITWQGKDGERTVEVPEEAVPASLIATIKDEIE